MVASRFSRVLFWAAELLLLAGVLAAAVFLSHGDEWHPAAVVVLVLGLGLLGQVFSVEIRDEQLSASLVAIVLAMSLLGPVPAAACGLSAMVLKSAVRRLTFAQWLNNLTAFAVVPFVGGLLARALAGDIHHEHTHAASWTAAFGLIVMGVFMVALLLNFLVIGLEARLAEGRSLRRQGAEYVPLLPGELASGVLATMLAIAYTGVGLTLLLAAVVVLIVFQRLTVALLRSEQRAEQLQARSRQLVGLQLGVLRTLLRALGMRDQATSRHSAAVARYARALASELGCSERERDVIHSAGLLHEIGKFTWPDRVLESGGLEEADQAIVRSHPQEGAILVGALDGYGEVADAILYHHERMDGRGYPAGLIGREIPLASRVLAVCSTYDTMTAPNGYRSRMTPEEAVQELRHGAANGQLDPELVERFVALLDRQGPSFAEGADFETELEFERRVQDLAEPRSADGGAERPPAPRSDWRTGIRDLRQRALNRS